MIRAGIVSIEKDNLWIGGRYYLHHLIRSIGLLPNPDKPSLIDVWWREAAAEDPYAEVRHLLNGPPIILQFPNRFWSRAVRRARRVLTGSGGAKDLFDAARIDVCFPIPLIENGGVPFVFWLPDFQYLCRPDLFTEERRMQLESYYSRNVRDCAQIVLSSNDAKVVFDRIFPDRSQDAHVVRFTSVPDSEWWEKNPSDVAKQYNLPDRFLIVCNQITRHKNHLILLDALAYLKRKHKDVTIVCTGSTFDHRNEGWVNIVMSRATELGLGDRIRILGLIPRRDQIALIRRSVGLLQPSMFEGWSTAIEDAKSLGKPIIASRIPVHLEQLTLQPQRFVECDDAVAWAGEIEEMIDTLEPGENSEQEARAAEDTMRRAQASGRGLMDALLAGAGATTQVHRRKTGW